MLRLKSSPLASVVGRFLLVSGLALSVLSQATAAHAAPWNPQVNLVAVAQSDRTEVARGGTIRFTAIAARQTNDFGPAVMTAHISKQFSQPKIVANTGFQCRIDTGAVLNSPSWMITCVKSVIGPAGNNSTDSISFTSVAPNQGMSTAMIMSVWPQNAADINPNDNVAQLNFKVR